MYEVSSRISEIAEREEVEKEMTVSESITVCQFGNRNAYKGRYFEDVKVKILKMFPGPDKRNVYLVETLDDKKLIGRAIVPSKTLKPFVSDKSKLYCPRFVQYNDQKTPLGITREEALRSLIK